MTKGITQQSETHSEIQDNLEDGTHGPSADGDPMGTPADNERVLWKGRPDVTVLARTAFHTRSVGLYFALLIVISMVLGNMSAAITCAILAVAALVILHLLAWHSRRTTLYILTDTRLIMRIGMAVETRINIPLKHVTSADLKMRSKTHGDIALKLGGERMLGYLLMLPHARPWRFARPEPMLRAVPDAEAVAAKLADACSSFTTIERNLIEVNVEAPASAQQGKMADKGMKGAPA